MLPIFFVYVNNSHKSLLVRFFFLAYNFFWYTLLDYGIYRCYGKLNKLFRSINDWLNRHPNEVLVLYFGKIDFENETLWRLKESLKASFGSRINDEYKKTSGRWPTLGQAIRDQKPIFIFMRTTNEIPEMEFVREIQIPNEEDTQIIGSNDVTIISTFKSK